MKVLLCILMVGVFFLNTGGLFAQDSIGGPYQPDSATVLLLHFDGDLTNESVQSADAQPHGNVGYISNAALGLGQCLWLDNDAPSDSSFIQIPDTAALDLTGSWTMEAWVNIITYGTNSSDWRWRPKMLVKPGTDTPSHSNYFNVMRGDFQHFRTGYFTPAARPWIQVESYDNILIPGAWYHVTFIRDSSKNLLAQMVHDQNMNLLSFGVRAFDPITESPPVVTDAPVYIGINLGQDGGWLDGFLDEIRISNVVRNFPIPPIITNVTELDNQPSTVASYTINADVSKIGSGQVQSVKLFYTDDTTSGSWNEVPMTLSSGLTYAGDIPGQDMGTMLYYYIEAQDEFGMTAMAPNNATLNGAYYSFGIWKPQSQTLALNFEEGDWPVMDTTAYSHAVDTFGTPYFSTDAHEGSYSIAFGQRDSSYLEVPSTFLGSEEFTVDLWFKPDTMPTHNNRLVALQGSPWYEINYQIRFDGSNGNILGSSYFPGIGYIDVADSAARITVGEWHRVIYSVAPDHIYFELRDASDQIIAQADTAVTGPPLITQGPLAIGHAGAQTAPYFVGKVDDIKIYNYAAYTFSGIEEDQQQMPLRFELAQNYPNPFNPSTEIRFSLPELQDVQLVVYDLLGRKVRTLVDKKMTPGSHTVVWNGVSDNGNPVSSGVYFYKLQSENYSNVRKMILMK